MLSRNRELRTFAGAYLVISLTLCIASLMVAGPVAAGFVFALACALGLITAIYTRARYRAIARLAQTLDERLHAGRAIRFDTMREGELAVLASELEKLITRLDLTAEQLEQERCALSDALADVSHQLKTPLTSLSLMCELIRKRMIERGGHLTDAEVADLVERLRTAQALQARVQWLVSALLKLARIDAGVVTFTKQQVSAKSLVHDAFEPLAISFDLADVAFDTQVQQGASFEGDHSWSVEALENVLKNCLEHTPAGGAVRVRAAQDAIACRIVVEDTGSGIREEDLPHVFERFYRGAAAAEGADSEVNPAGVGIGLALSHSLIAGQGGQIVAENATDAAGSVTGARFTITFFNTTV